MDLYSAVKLYESYANKETFDDNTTTANTSYSIATLIISLLISFYAVYLSWSCNTTLGINTGLKVLYAFFAFIFGLLYLIFYLIFRAGQCNQTSVTSKSSNGGRK